ncbi:MAG: SRPBCC family protein [Myxococcota bacterium]|nr:SRPBCC family protein [Myxococcota bacterium]
MLGILTLLLALTPPTAPTLTESEEATLAARKPVVRTTQDSVLAVIDVAAPPSEVIAAVLDVEARKDEVGSIEKVTLYQDTAEKKAVRYDLSLMGFDAAMNLIYEIDSANHYVRYYTDDTQDNDISGSAGSYHAVPLKMGASRLYYRVDVPDSGPAFIKKALLENNLPEQIQGIRARAEQ